MGFFRCRFGVVQRSRGGSVIRRAAYQSCQRIKAPDGRVFDWTKGRAGHGHVQTLMITPVDSPEWTADVQTCWTKATAAERRVDAQEARTIEISLPRALPPKLLESCVRALVAPYVAEGMIVQADIHALRAADGGLNPHVHLLLSLRRADGAAFAQRKAREWNQFFYRNPKKLRAEIAGILNEFCARHGVAYRADSRSNKARGLALPEPTIPRWNVLVAQRTGRRTGWMVERDEARAARRRLAAFKAELAAIDQAIQIKQIVERLRAIDPAATIVAFMDGKPAATRPAAILDRRPYRLGRRSATRPASSPSILLPETEAEVRDYQLAEICPQRSP